MDSSKDERKNVSNDNASGAASDDIPLTTINSTRLQGKASEGTDLDQNNRILRGSINPTKNIADNLIPLPVNPDMDVILNTEFQFPPLFNKYRNRKTLAEGLIDIALFSANTNQLRSILVNKSQQHAAIFYTTVSLLIISLILQVAVGLLLFLSTRYNICVECQQEKAFTLGNYALMGFFLITILNIFIAGFGVL